LEEYQPKNDNEKKITQLLRTYLDARNSGDLIRLQSTFHDRGVYYSGRGGKFTKSQIAETEPEWWVGDGKVDLVGLKFNIDGNQAIVFATAVYGSIYKTAHKFTLINENNNWFIIKVE
jgi:hypothetical protein